MYTPATGQATRATALDTVCHLLRAMRMAPAHKAMSLHIFHMLFGQFPAVSALTLCSVLDMHPAKALKLLSLLSGNWETLAAIAQYIAKFTP